MPIIIINNKEKNKNQQTYNKIIIALDKIKIIQLTNKDSKIIISLNKTLIKITYSLNNYQVINILD